MKPPLKYSISNGQWSIINDHHKTKFSMVNDQWSIINDRSSPPFFRRANAFPNDGTKLLALAYHWMNIFRRKHFGSMN